MTKEANHIALLLVAAKAHEDWEAVSDETGTPTGVLRECLATGRTHPMI